MSLPPLFIVFIKLREAIIDLTPAVWREKMVRSTEEPLWLIIEERGG